MKRLGKLQWSQEEEKWGLTGLLHDVDFDLSKHSIVRARWLENGNLAKK
ncbi:MAG: hypothetical protein L5655_06225 [Thermosediminibacteraceae bacterium]|nr:hypothetical protein [Thermosediminibacteraceae bacterium]